MGKITDALKKAEKERTELIHRGRVIKEEVEDRPIEIVPDGTAHPAIVCYNALSSKISEQYKILRTNILGLNHERPLKSLVIASALRNEGKTVTALNLASTFAQKEQSKVLFVEADLRKPKAHFYMGLDVKSGLSELLTGEGTLNTALYSTRFPNLKILPAGKRLPSNPPELLVSSRMKKIMGELQEKFDYIIIDSPPTISVTDASILGALCDGVILVVKAGSTDRKLVERAQALMTHARANILGFIITTVSDYPHYYIY